MLNTKSNKPLRPQIPQIHPGRTISFLQSYRSEGIELITGTAQSYHFLGGSGTKEILGYDHCGVVSASLFVEVE